MQVQNAREHGSFQVVGAQANGSRRMITSRRILRHWYGRHRGKLGTIYEYYTCLSRVHASGPCGARSVRLSEIEDHLERIHAKSWLTPTECDLVRIAVRDSMHAKTKVARDEADRHARRLRDLETQHEKLLQLYYRDGVSIETMQQEQARIKLERAEVERWQQIALVQVDNVVQSSTRSCC